MKHKLTYYYRKIHRFLGVILGIQLLFWTLGGLFFSWSDMDQIHGDTNHKTIPLISDFSGWSGPSEILNSSQEILEIDSLVSFKLINFLGSPFYQIRYYRDGSQKIVLIDARTGEPKPEISKQEAVLLAEEVFTPRSKIKNLEYITELNISKHHEYRGKPLPAYAVRFNHESGTIVYVSAEYGEVMAFRNTNWRIFDFLWMMHTMDYQGRDNIGKLLLRMFSVLGLLTVISGFLLFFKTSRKVRNVIKAKNKTA